MNLKDRVEIVDKNSKCFGMKGTVENISDNIIFVLFDNRQPPLPALGSFYDFNLKILKD